MVEPVSPSERHLKRELSALQKARFLRDPETTSSWRSPKSSRSFVVTSNLNYEKRRKKVYLHNWGRRSSKSSDSGMKLDEDNIQGSVKGSPEGCLDNPMKVDPNTNTKASRRRATWKSRRSAASRKRACKNSPFTKDLDLPPSSSLRLLDSLERSDDATEYSNSEDLQQATQKHTQTIGYAPHDASPLFSLDIYGTLKKFENLNNSRREGSSNSHTSASNNFYNKNGGHSYTTNGSWDGSRSFDEYEVDQMNLKNRRGCGIPRYGSKKTKHRGCSGCCSPSLSDTLSTKGRGMLCGSKTLYNKRRSSDSGKQKYLSRSPQGLTLLINTCHRGGTSVATESDGLSTNLSELDMEALSRLDGTRWSRGRSQEEQELALPSIANSEIPVHRVFSQKYRPRSFDEIIGQNIVVQSLSDAISREMVPPAYIFQGPPGTGKTSIARIFAAALNCVSPEENKPCGYCSECANSTSRNGSKMIEVYASSKKDLRRLRLLMKSISISAAFSRYNVFVIEECHMLSSKSWSIFTKFLEEPVPRVIFIFMVTNPDNLPRTIISRCPKYLFHKIKEADIMSRLRKISAEENLDVELDALDLIAFNSDGSLRDAETTLGQLSLLGKQITTSLVNDLVGVVSDEKLLDILETALSSNIAETVTKSRELMNSRVDPVALMSQFAGLIRGIIAGSCHLSNSHHSGRFLCGKNLTDADLKKLQQALKILSDTEKQLRLSSERSTWFTAALLQLGSIPTLEATHSSFSSKRSNEKGNAGKPDKVKRTSLCVGANPSSELHDSSLSAMPNNMSGRHRPHDCSAYNMPKKENIVCNSLPRNSISVEKIVDVTHKDEVTINGALKYVSPEKLEEIWRRCIERCHSMTLRQLLSNNAELVSITETEGVLTADILFGGGNIKSRAEGFMSSIRNSIERVLRRNVELRIGLLPENYPKARKMVTNCPSIKHTNEMGHDESSGSGKDNQYRSNPQLPRRSSYSSKKNHDIYGTNGRWQGSSKQETLLRYIGEQRLESSRLQSAENSATRLTGHLGKNPLLAQSDANDKSQHELSTALSLSSKLRQDGLSHGTKESSINEESSINDNISRFYGISPSPLHSSSFRSNFDKQKTDYESGPGSGFCCWKTYKADRTKVKQGKDARSQKRGCFGQRKNRMGTDYRLRR